MKKINFKALLITIVILNSLLGIIYLFLIYPETMCIIILSLVFVFLGYVLYDLFSKHV